MSSQYLSGCRPAMGLMSARLYGLAIARTKPGHGLISTAGSPICLLWLPGQQLTWNLLASQQWPQVRFCPLAIAVCQVESALLPLSLVLHLCVWCVLGLLSCSPEDRKMSSLCRHLCMSHNVRRCITTLHLFLAALLAVIINCVRRIALRRMFSEGLHPRCHPRCSCCCRMIAFCSH